MQVFFPKKLNFIPFFSKGKPQRLFAGSAALFRLDIYQNDVRSYPANAVPWDHKIVPGRPKPAQLAPAGDHNGADLPFWQLDDHIVDKPQPLATAHADDLLAVQIRKLG